MTTASGAVDRLITPEYLAASAAAVRYVHLQSCRVLAEIGFWSRGARGRTVGELSEQLGVSPVAEPMFAWLLDQAHAAGAAALTVDGRYAAHGGAPASADLAAAAQDLDAHDATVGSSHEMIDYVAERYAAVLLGRRSAMSVLFKGPGLEVWERYFSAANPLYNVHNELAAEGLRLAWADGPPPRTILELGTGTGGATAAMARALDAWPGGRDVDLVLSDVSRSFLARTGERCRASGLAIRTMRLDFTLPLEGQGVAAGSVDAIVATNALHAARDLAGTLSSVRGALAPGGRLIVSESLCGSAESVHQEFVFNLLGRPAGHSGSSRFLTGAQWERLLQGAGWTPHLITNSRGPELAMLAVASPAGG